jgi:hypothetical protein
MGNTTDNDIMHMSCIYIYLTGHINLMTITDTLYAGYGEIQTKCGLLYGHCVSIYGGISISFMVTTTIKNYHNRTHVIQAHINMDCNSPDDMGIYKNEAGRRQ